MQCTALRRLLVASAAAVFGAAQQDAPAAPLPVLTRQLTVDGVARTFELTVPPAAASAGTARLPVILSFHGDGGHAARQAEDDHLREIAGGIALIVHGQGVGTEQETGDDHPTWNGGGASMQALGPEPQAIAPDGETCDQETTTGGNLMVSCAKEIGSGAAANPCWWSNCLDDVAYVVAILDLLEAEYSVDTASIFGTGDSNGAMFLYQLIADPRTGHRFAAVAPVAGLPHNGFLFRPANPALRYLNIWGTADTYIVAECPDATDITLKSGPGCCGWYYSCIENTTRLFADLHGFDSSPPRPLAAPLAPPASEGGPTCRGFSKAGGDDDDVSSALVVDCSWEGPHGWPQIGEIGWDQPCARWPAEVILDFFLAEPEEDSAPKERPSLAANDGGCRLHQLGEACAAYSSPLQPSVCGTHCEDLAAEALRTGLGCELEGRIRATLTGLVENCGGGGRGEGGGH